MSYQISTFVGLLLTCYCTIDGDKNGKNDLLNTVACRICVQVLCMFLRRLLCMFCICFAYVFVFVYVCVRVYKFHSEYLYLSEMRICLRVNSHSH